MIAGAVSANLIRIDDPVNQYLDLTEGKAYPMIRQMDNQDIFAMTHETLSKVNVTSKNRLLVNMGINEIGMNWAKDTENGFIWHSGDLGVYHSYLGVCLETNAAIVVLSKLTDFDYLWPITIGAKILKSFER